MWDERGPFARRHHRTININIDPSALGHPALHEVAMQADARLALDDLLAALGATPAASAMPAGCAGMRAVRASYEAQAGRDGRATRTEVMHPAALAKAIADALPADALAVLRRRPHHLLEQRLHAGARGAHALPRARHEPPRLRPALCACRCSCSTRAAPVFNITGDGSFGFTLNELDTARRAGLPVVTHHPQQRGLGHHPRGPEDAARLRVRAPASKAPTTPPSRAASAASARP